MTAGQDRLNRGCTEERGGERARARTSTLAYVRAHAWARLPRRIGTSGSVGRVTGEKGLSPNADLRAFLEEWPGPGGGGPGPGGGGLA